MYSCSVYSCHLFLISSASVRSFLLLSFYMSIFAWNVPLISLIFWRDLSFSPFYCFLHFLCIVLLRRLFVFFFFFFNLSFSPLSALLVFSQLFVRPHKTTILPCWISFSWGWFWSLSPVRCYESLSIVLQALCLSHLIPWIYWSLPLYNRKGFDSGHTWMV